MSEALQPGSEPGVSDGASRTPDPAKPDTATPPVDKVEDPPPEADFA